MQISVYESAHFWYNGLTHTNKEINQMHIIINTKSSYGKQSVIVKSLEEASSVWKAHRNGGNDDGVFLGGSDMKKDCGNVYSDEGKLIAEVMFNGRIEEK